MFPKKGPDITPLKDQLKAILSFKLIHSAKSVLEKLFWIIIAVGGTIYITYIVSRQFEYWNENPVLRLKGSKPLTEVKRPAITFCHSGAQKYAFIERFVNYIDINKSIPFEIYAIRNEVIKANVYMIKKQLQSPSVEVCNVRKNQVGLWEILKGSTVDKTKNSCVVMT